jgi:vacuolar-type H+-ATPase catalytic subunit A/Vma1
MTLQHKNLTNERWRELTFFERMANVGSEVERAIKWKNKNNVTYSVLAFERALELLDLTIGNETESSHFKELARMREMLADYFVFENIYNSSDEQWQKYFYAFNFAARRNH